MSRSRCRKRSSCRARSFESDGRGASLPVASNDTAQGRALNRRVEVEFWYDDPLQELSERAAAVSGRRGRRASSPRCTTRPGARIEPLKLENGRALIPAGYTEQPAPGDERPSGSQERAAAVHRLHGQRSPGPPHRDGLRRRRRVSPRRARERAMETVSARDGSRAVAGRARGPGLRALGRRRERGLHPRRRHRTCACRSSMTSSRRSTTTKAWTSRGSRASSSRRARTSST